MAADPGYGHKQNLKYAQEDIYKAQAQCNAAPRAPGPSVSGVANEFEAVLSRLENYASQLSAIADRLSGPEATVGQINPPEPVTQGTLSALYHLRSRMDQVLDHISNDVRRFDVGI